MSDLESLQKLLAPLLPGLLGMSLTEVSNNRVAATLLGRRDVCTTGDVLHGGAIMAFADTLGAVGTFVNLPSALVRLQSNPAPDSLARAPGRYRYG